MRLRLAPRRSEQRLHRTGYAAGQVPLPPREHGPWAVAIALGAVGVALLVAVLSGMLGGTHEAAAGSPPPVLVVAPTPTRALAAAERATAVGRAGRGAPDPAPRIRRPRAEGRQPIVQPTGFTRFVSLEGEGITHIPASWVRAFFPIYATAQRTFDVNWLLIASIHKQETAFSTAASTYHGLNFAHCCGGPMQFNVTNGPVTTWALVRNAYRYATRPAIYDHMTRHHPSIYDDFDSIMAAAWLLSADGARFALSDSAWWAAYDYYGHDEFGVSYADEVLARAIGWSQHGFCINCEVETALVSAVHEAYGAPVLAALEREAARAERTRAARARRQARSRRARARRDAEARRLNALHSAAVPTTGSQR